MGTEPRMTLQTQLVLKVLLAAPRQEHYGLELAREAGLASGTIYPLLARLENAGWLESGWEDINEAREGRRKRRYYKLTGHGAREARKIIESTKQRMFPELVGVPS